jgi:hypothetical protein
MHASAAPDVRSRALRRDGQCTAGSAALAAAMAISAGDFW